MSVSGAMSYLDDDVSSEKEVRGFHLLSQDIIYKKLLSSFEKHQSIYP